MATLRQFTPEAEIYSIDEAFLDLSGFGGTNLAEYAQQIRTTAKRWTGITVSIGIAETKTLAKIANRMAKKAGAGMGAYAASKAGVLRLTESLAEEEKNTGVRVNAVLPTIIDTPRNRADMPKADFTRWVKPEEIAKAILFLLSGDATAITGAELLISGRT